MKITEIKVGKYYRTQVGNGECKAVGGTHPPSVKFFIAEPIPRGIQYLKPRDVLEEIAPPEIGTKSIGSMFKL